MQIKKGGGRTAEGSRRESGEEREKNKEGGVEGDEIGGLRSSGITHLKEKREREKLPPRPASSNLSSIQPFECQGRGSRDLFPTGFHVQNQKEKGRGGGRRGYLLLPRRNRLCFRFPLATG